MEGALSSLAVYIIFLSTSIIEITSFQTSNNDHHYHRSTIKLSGYGGTDAYEAQLAAMHNDVATKSDTSNTIEDNYAVEIMDNSRRSAVVEAIQSSNENNLAIQHNIGDLLMQRAIQTQLYYLSNLRDEPTYVWLREFLGHDHLDDRGQFNKLDGLRCSNGWQGYLNQLEQAPPFTIVVQLAPPKLNAQQRRNPYLAKEQTAGRTYQEIIMPINISRTLCTVARSLESEWVPILNELASTDQIRVNRFDLDVAQLHSTTTLQQDNASRQRVAGGEGDDQDTPLHALNARLVARFCTRIAILRTVEELEDISLPFDANADDETRSKFAAADADALQWMKAYAREWVPRLMRGADDDRRRQLGVAPPGHWQRLCEGADADDATESLWQELPELFANVSEEAMRLYSPEALAIRLRRARVDVCRELVSELQAEVIALSCR